MEIEVQFLVDFYNATIKKHKQNLAAWRDGQRGAPMKFDVPEQLEWHIKGMESCVNMLLDLAGLVLSQEKRRDTLAELHTMKQELQTIYDVAITTADEPFIQEIRNKMKDIDGSIVMVEEIDERE